MSIQTTLPNDMEFFGLLDAFRADAESSEYCVAALDIEHFKLFNEWYGWDQGDAVLRALADHLEQHQRASKGFSAYFGNDDFLIVLRDDDALIAEVRNHTQSLVSSSGKAAPFTMRMGVCSIAKYPDAGAHDLCNYAQIASMLQLNGKEHIGRFSGSSLEATREEAELLADIENAISNGEFAFHLQPQCNSATRTVVGLEALVRWEHPTRGTLGPMNFVPLLERSGLIVELDTYIWEEVCKLLAQWKRQGRNLVPISVNVSIADIETIDVPQYLLRLVQKYDIEPRMLRAEVTESMMAQNPDEVNEMARGLHEAGFTLLMDDFGSGYSSLNMLKDTNVDVIKLDMRLIDLNNDNFDKGRQIVESVVKMAHQIGLPVVAEGVETQEQVRMLQALDCLYTQGYKFYRPMPVEHAEVLLAQPGNEPFWDMAHDSEGRPDAHEEPREHLRDVAGHAGQIIADTLLGLSLVNLVTGEFEFVKRTEPMPATGKGNMGNLADYSNMVLDLGLVHEDYIDEFRMRTNPDRLRGLMFSGAFLRTFTFRTTLKDKGEWVTLGIATCSDCSPQNPWAAIFVRRENYETIPAAARRHSYETDPLTNLLNRAKFQSDLDSLQYEDCSAVTIIYVDAIGLHEVNNHVGHAQGDLMLQCIAEALSSSFLNGKAYRIGGDEFVVIDYDVPADAVGKALSRTHRRLLSNDIEISCGVARVAEARTLADAVDLAEARMRENKAKHYADDGQGRQLRMLDQRLERMLQQKRDAERCLEQLLPQYTGIYVVNMTDDTMRGVRVPEGFRNIIESSDETSFREGAKKYCDATMDPQYRGVVYELLDYDFVRSQIWAGKTITRRYVRNDGVPFSIHVVPYSDELSLKDCTLWMFSRDDMQGPVEG